MWQKRKSDISSIAELIQSRQIGEIVGYNDIPEDYLPGINNLHETAEMLASYLLENRIVIYGDYDSDGICSTIIMTKALRNLTEAASRVTGKKASEIKLMMPDRYEGGYGFKETDAKKIEGSVIILLDNGTTQYDAIKAAKERGNIVIVIDHHESGLMLPDADAIINPHVTGGEYEDYCASGLAYRTARAMYSLGWVQNTIPEAEIKETIKEMLFLASIGTIGDVVPVRGENRAIIQNGTRMIPESWKSAIDILCNEEKETITETDVGFSISPAFNSVGRMGKLTEEFVMSLAFGTEYDRQRAATHMRNLNEKRKQATNSVMERISYLNTFGIETQVVQDDDIPIGIVGIIAGKVAERSGKPSFVFGPPQDGLITGSGRCKDICTIDLKQALDEISTRMRLEKYGGHQSAAGVTIHEDDLTRFAEEFERAVHNVSGITINDSIAQYYDLELDETENWSEIYDEIRRYSPYGEGNPEPVFRCVFHPVSGMSETMGKGKHIKIRNEYYNVFCGFGMGDLFSKCLDADSITVYGTMNMNCYRRSREIQLIVQDMEIMPKRKNQFQEELQQLLL